jgi:hypothetical protein
VYPRLADGRAEAPAIVVDEFIHGTLERPIITPGEDDAKPLLEQLTACLEPQAAVRAGDNQLAACIFARLPAT